MDRDGPEDGKENERQIPLGVGGIAEPALVDDVTDHV